MPLLKKAKHVLEYGAFRIVEAVFSALPLEMASAFSGWGWRVIAPLTRRHGRAIANLRLAFPEKSDRDCDRIARDMWENLGRAFGEFFHLDEIHSSDRIDASPLTPALAIFDGTTPAIVCAAHQANWEIASMAPVRIGARPVGIYQRLSNPLVDKRIHQKRARYYPGGLLEKSPAAGAAALRHLRAGGSLALLADLRDSLGLNVQFMGRPAPSTPFPARMARVLSAPLVALFMRRLPGARFVVSYEIIDTPRTGDQPADVLAATQALQSAFERSIRACPEQWMWAHRRWG